MLAACSVIVRDPICTTSPNGTTAKVIMHREEREKRRERVEKLVGAVGHEVFLGEKFQRIGDQRC